jgi:hypothetical protein
MWAADKEVLATMFDERQCGTKVDSRIDIIKTTEVLQHAVTKANIIAGLAPKETTLFCL